MGQESGQPVVAGGVQEAVGAAFADTGDVGDDDGSELVDLLADSAPGPEELAVANEEDRMVTGLLDVLDGRARFAVEQRFGLHDGRKRSYREVGEELGVTAEAARRMVKRAVNTVRTEASHRIDAA